MQAYSADCKPIQPVLRAYSAGPASLFGRSQGRLHCMVGPPWGEGAGLTICELRSSNLDLRTVSSLASFGRGGSPSTNFALRPWIFKLWIQGPALRGGRLPICKLPSLDFNLQTLNSWSTFGEGGGSHFANFDLRLANSSASLGREGSASANFKL